jgi:hypothetical protein
MKSRVKKFRSNLKLARALWGDIPDSARGNLREFLGSLLSLSLRDTFSCWTDVVTSRIRASSELQKTGIA